jgi:hypothetical protein
MFLYVYKDIQSDQNGVFSIFDFVEVFGIDRLYQEVIINFEKNSKSKDKNYRCKIVKTFQPYEEKSERAKIGAS